MKKRKLTFLESYILQKDMRVRLPKAILHNFDLVKGESIFDIYTDLDNQEIILKIQNPDNTNLNKDDSRSKCD